MKAMSKNVGEFVAEDYRTAAVFQKYGIDFCCKGNKSLEEVCEDKHIPEQEILQDLSAIKAKANVQPVTYQSWPLGQLADHIERKHHNYVERAIPVLSQYIDKVCTVHGSRHPELFEIAAEFKASAGELIKHMKKEELVLFPHIRKLIKSADDKTKQNSGNVKSRIKEMLQEHDTEGERFKKIALLSNHYTPPSDACNTYRTAFRLLKEFEDDLHLHIHLENNILFPKAIELENRANSLHKQRNYETVSEAIADLIKRGYVTDFSVLVDKECLVCHKTDRELSPDDFEIDETYRFEGDSDPGDEMIVFAISSAKYDMKGYVVNAYGMYSDPSSSKIVNKLIQHL